jgi:hypothetical protein
MIRKTFTNRSILAGLALLMSAVAAPALAGTPALSLAPVGEDSVAAPARQPALDLSALHAQLALPYAQANAAALVGLDLPKTAIEHSFSRTGLTGSAGFLCGRHASPDNNGAATERGYDPQGRFVGAKLSLAFR